jgi:His-Xaa-Ser system protein HxsD
VNDPPEGFSSDSDSELSATIRLDSRAYSKEAILRTCHWFSDIAYIHLPESPDGKFVVHVLLKPISPTLANPKPATIDVVVGEFCNSLLEFELRRQVEAETAPVRQLILAKAFSESGILEDEPPGTIGDPVGIDQPDSLVQIGGKLAPRD